ncbi:MAG: mandelate racemase/muconate lactonizing enzyme family protein [Gammaproteobacteria bacterium]|nr:mandelate racemase/muconate lactonizing enzyme family protein [Gammaproteobacteria bacterium]
MKIIALETIRLKEFPNLIWVQVQTENGTVGLGESFFGAEATEAYIHETAAPKLLGQDARRIEQHSWTLRNGYLGFSSSGAEMRGLSAIDIALWDIWGQSTGQPVYQLLGGLSRDSIRTYNTCAGYQYVRGSQGQLTDNWGLDQQEGPYEDLNAFLTEAGTLAESLLNQNITAMKIWPFDKYAEASNGTYIANEDLDKALEPFRKIRNTVGNKIDIMVEFHSLWNVPTAKKIFAALEEFNPFWFEDPIKMNNSAALAELAASTRVPICASETLATRFGYNEFLSKQAIGVVMPDLSWCGGLSEARKIAAMAETNHLPVAPHDCTGPVVFIASCHLSLNAPNALFQESVRAFYSGWYPEIVDQMPLIKDGHIYPMDGPGLGTALRPEIKKRADALIRRSSK